MALYFEWDAKVLAAPDFVVSWVAHADTRNREATIVARGKTRMEISGFITKRALARWHRYSGTSR
jgi:predicted XRE-type DNA-binding protein